MSTFHDDCLTARNAAGLTSDARVGPRAGPAGALLTGLLAACGSGSGGAPEAGPVPPPVRETVTPERAARFLGQASMGATREQIAMVQSLGYAGWIDEQFALPASGTRWDWLVARGYAIAANAPTEAGVDACQWRKLLTSHDTLRQRVTLALSEILVTSVSGFNFWGWSAFSAAAHLDTLEAHAFGNYRILLERISQSAPMAEFLTYLGNEKFNANTGAMPDENYARELLQLFTIGLVELKLDGTPLLRAGHVTESYTQDDVTGLARVFTGWDYDMAGGNAASPDYKRRALIQSAAKHESGSKTFLGRTIAAGTDGVSSLAQAIDIIFDHPNVGPFIGRQLILRMVCSNPSPGYVARVATAFNNNGLGVKGDLKAVIRAILLDPEARGSDTLVQPQFGKLREPILRFCAWGRAFAGTSPNETWLGETSDPGMLLGQSPLRAPSVFNFFRPGYVPANTALSRAGMVAPEFQITNESSVIGYVNFMQDIVLRGAGDVRADYSALMPLADDAGLLLAELNLLLAAGQLSAPTLTLIGGALNGMAAGSDAARRDRIGAAIVMLMATPEFLIQK